MADTIRTKDELLRRVGVGTKLVRAQRVRDIVATMFAMDIKRAGTIIEARNLDRAALSDGDEVVVFGYTTPGEHPGVTYFWDADQAQADNAGTILQLSDGGTGRLVMAPYAEYDPRWWGCKGDDSAADDVPFLLCTGQMAPGRTILIPNTRQGYNLRFVMRMTDQIALGDSMWHGKIKCSGGAGGSFGSGNTYFPFHCDFDDSAKAQFLVNATMEFENLRLFMDGNTTTAVKSGQNGGGTPMAPIIKGANITSCGMHGIIADKGVAILEHIRIDNIAGISGIKTTGNGSVGVLIGSDGRFADSEIAAGFHMGAVYAGNNWTSENVYHDQCRIGALVAGIEGRINGGRCAFNWSAGIKYGAGALTTIAGLDVSGNSPRQITETGMQFHRNGLDKVGSADNLNSTDIWLDAVGASRIRTNCGRGGNQIDNDAFDETTHGIRVSGTVIDHFSVHGADFSGYVDGETVFYVQSGTLWATSQAKSIGDLVYNTVGSYDHVYRATTAGTTGGTAPTHVDGEIVSDGAVSWAHCGIRNQDTNAVVEFHRSTIEQGDAIAFIDRQTWYGGTKITDGAYNPAA